MVPANAAYDIIWLRDGVPIAGATGAGHIVTQDDLGTTLTVEITGTGDFTGSLSAQRTVPAVAPNAPTALTATPGDAQVTLGWGAPDFDGGGSVMGYEVSMDSGVTWIPVGLVTSYTVAGLTNDTPYTFWVRAVNIGGNGPFASVGATPHAPPEITSITPTAATAALFQNVTWRGMTAQAVFDVAGFNLTPHGIANAFGKAGYSSWIQPTYVYIVDFIDANSATVTLTLTILPNWRDARTGRVDMTDGTVIGRLTVTQAGGPAPAYRVTIVNAPAGGAAPDGQSETVRMIQAGRNVTLVAGTREGHVFSHWSTVSRNVLIFNPGGPVTNFTMPSSDVAITANWTVAEQLPAPEPHPSPPPASGPPAYPGDGNSGGGHAGAGSGSESGNAGGTAHDMPEASGTVTGTPNQGGDAATQATQAGAGFLSWLRDNLWWVWLSFGALLFLLWWFIFWRRRKKDDDEGGDPVKGSANREGLLTAPVAH